MEKSVILPMIRPFRLHIPAKSSIFAVENLQTDRKMRKLLIVLGLMLPTLLLAETKEERAASPHEVRLLVGDMLCESLFWYDDAHADYTGLGSASSVFVEQQHTFWTPHFAGEYQYRLNDWCSVGAQVDFQYTGWHRVTYNTMNAEVDNTREHFYNLSFLPTVRFTYFHSPYVNLYSSVGLGLDVNGGTETDIHGKRVAFGAALDIAVLGLSAGANNWFGSMEVGGLSALKNKGTMFMMASRILTVGVGYRF